MHGRTCFLSLLLLALASFGGLAFSTNITCVVSRTDYFPDPGVKPPCTSSHRECISVKVTQGVCAIIDPGSLSVVVNCVDQTITEYLFDRNCTDYPYRTYQAGECVNDGPDSHVYNLNTCAGSALLSWISVLLHVLY